MPRRTGEQWPREGARGRCPCDVCPEVEAATSAGAAIDAARRTMGRGLHFEITSVLAITTAGDGEMRTEYTAHELAPADATETAALDAGGVLAGCACTTCHERRTQGWGLLSTPESAPTSQALPEPTPEPTPDPLAQVAVEEPAEEEPATVACCYCGDDCPEDEVVFMGTRRTSACCPSCRVTCEHCEEEELADEARRVTVPGGWAQDWCATCWEDHAWTCYACESTYSDSVYCRYAADDEDQEQPLCPTCFRRVEATRDPVVYGVGSYHDEQRRRTTRLIDSPWTTAHGGRRFGVELEVERIPSATRSAAALADALLVAAHAVDPWRQQGHRLMWAERDGSLVDGVELITAPAGLDVQRDLWRAVLDRDEVKQLRSHDTTTCGLHVHVTRPGAWLTAKAAQWLALPTTEELVRLVARRYNVNYARMEHRPLRRSTVHGWNRYEALNTSNAATVEFRVFRGTLKPDTVLACVEFAHAVLAFLEDVSARELAAADTGARFVRRIHAPDLHADTAHLRGLLARRTEDHPTRAPRIAAALAAIPTKTKRTPAPVACPTTETED